MKSIISHPCFYKLTHSSFPPIHPPLHKTYQVVCSLWLSTTQYILPAIWQIFDYLPYWLELKQNIVVYQQTHPFINHIIYLSKYLILATTVVKTDKFGNCTQPWTELSLRGIWHHCLSMLLPMLHPKLFYGSPSSVSIRGSQPASPKTPKLFYIIHSGILSRIQHRKVTVNTS